MRNQTERDMYERELRRERDVSRSNTAATNGLLIGIMIVAIAGAFAAFYAISENSKPAETQIITPPSVNVEPPAAVQPPDINITTPAVQPPDVNITNPAPATEATPSPESAAPTQPTPKPAPQQ